MTRKRADLVLVERGFCESRAKAQAAIAAGGVRADGVVVARPSDLIAERAAIAYTPEHPWVSRGGVKLAHAIDAFGVDPAARVCLDVGASTGGFTQVLLARGAARVYAVDVGSAQLHAALRGDPRVISLENTDARRLTRALVPEHISLIVCDVSFIGAAKALSASFSLAAKHAELVVLIKPQFEAGPGQGRVLEETVARRAADAAVGAFSNVEGFNLVAVIDSPIRGGEGNLERLAHFRR